MSLRERLIGPTGEATPPELGHERLLAAVFQWPVFDRLDTFTMWAWRVSDERGPLSWLADRVSDSTQFINARRAYVAWRKNHG